MAIVSNKSRTKLRSVGGGTPCFNSVGNIAASRDLVPLASSVITDPGCSRASASSMCSDASRRRRRLRFKCVLPINHHETTAINGTAKSASSQLSAATGRPRRSMITLGVVIMAAATEAIQSNSNRFAMASVGMTATRRVRKQRGRQWSIASVASPVSNPHRAASGAGEWRSLTAKLMEHSISGGRRARWTNT